MKRAVIAVLAAAGMGLAVMAAAGTAGASIRPDGTPSCGNNCVNISNQFYGTDYVLNFNKQGPVKTVPGAPVAMRQEGNGFFTEDAVLGGVERVSQLVHAGIISKTSYVALNYGSHYAAELKSEPDGTPTDLCAGLVSAAYPGELVTAQMCGSTDGRTWWVFDPANGGATGGGTFCLSGAGAQSNPCPLINASDTASSGPEVLTAGATNHSQLVVDPELVYSNGQTADMQLWSYDTGINP